MSTATQQPKQTSEAATPAADARPKLVVIDGTNQSHILWHGAQGKCSVGLWLKSRCQAMQIEWGAAMVTIAFDSPDSFRKQLDVTYKAHRPPQHDGLREQIDAAPAILSEAGFPILGADGFEADDAIASMCIHARRRGYRVIVVSADKDVRQCLVAGEVTIVDKIQVAKNKLTANFITAAKVLDKYGVRPDQWIDYQCLVGDTTDGIIGATGIGEKTAAKLLQTGATLEDLVTNPWKYASSTAIRDSLFEFKIRAEIVKQLVTLRTDVPFVEECFL